MLLPIRDKNPRLRFPLVSYGIIAANAILFMQQIGIGLQLSIWQNGVIPWELTHFESIDIPSRVGPLQSLVTSMFRHGGILHFLGNMLYLWIFGNNVEYALGHFKFLVFYLIAGVAGMVAHVLTNPFSVVPAVGASGAIAGLLGAYILLYPRARIQTIVFLIVFVQIIDLPAVLVVGLWAFLQALEGLGSSAGVTGIAVFAHLGGFVFGCAAIELFMRRKQ